MLQLNEYTFAQAVANNKLKTYQAYYDSSSALASARKYKFLGPSGVDDTAFRKNKGYWVYVNGSEGGNLTLAGVGGSTAGQTYNWNKLRFSNSSGTELDIVSAGNATFGWISSTKYWNTNDGDFRNINSIGIGNDKTIFSSWEGVFIKSNVDNLTLIRQN